MSDLQALAPNGMLLYTFDFAAEVPTGINVMGVAYVVPPPLASFVISHDFANRKSTIGLQNAAHGATYQVRAVATLSNNEQVPKILTVRGYNG